MTTPTIVLLQISILLGWVCTVFGTLRKENRRFKVFVTLIVVFAWLIAVGHTLGGLNT